ncbi:MAG: putative DNA-binding domain-containing protein [Sphingobacteriaceae bacterium]|nr:putative DNA-binding domain-containing protein [Sphingobacteriaceae bacterium]
MSDLSTVQKWLTSIIVRPGKLQDKINAADRTYQVDYTRLIKSSHITATDRIHVYARGYVLRLMECMRADYPALQALLGPALFDTFAQAYLSSLPSHSPSLFDLGKSFPDFIKVSQPPVADTETGHSMFDLPVELAMAERARSEVLRSKGLEQIQSAGASESFMFELLQISLRISPCLRLLKLSYPLISFIRSAESKEHAATPEKRNNFMAICRKNYAIAMYELEDWQWYFLTALSESNYTEAVGIAAENSGIKRDTLLADLMIWLPGAKQMGMVYEEGGEV